MAQQPVKLTKPTAPNAAKRARLAMILKRMSPANG